MPRCRMQAKTRSSLRAYQQTIVAALLIAEGSAQERQSVEGVVKYETIQFSRLRLLDRLSGFVETLQGELESCEISVWGDIIRVRAGVFPVAISAAFSYCPSRRTRCPAGDEPCNRGYSAIHS